MSKRKASLNETREWSHDQQSLHAHHTPMPSSTSFSGNLTNDGNAIVGNITAQRDNNINFYTQSDKTTDLKVQFCESLAFPQSLHRIHDIPEAASGTYQWVLEPEQGNTSSGRGQLQQWFQSDNGLIWVHGKAGAGKSCFMKYLVTNNRVQAQLKRLPASIQYLCVAFFAWKPGRPLQSSLCGLLRTIIGQIARWLPRLPLSITQPRPDRPDFCFMDYMRESYWPSGLLKELLDVFLDELTQSNTRLAVFIDGLDEMTFDTRQERDQMFKVIGRLEARPNVKICISSRPEQIFVDSYIRGPKLCLQDENERDIKEVAQRELHSLLNKRYPDKAVEIDQLIWQIHARSEGVFLWASLVVDELRRDGENFENFAKLSQKLDLVPSDIENLYEKILTDIGKAPWADEATRFFELLLINREYGMLHSPFTLLHFALCEPHVNSMFRKQGMSFLATNDFARAWEQLRGRINICCKSLISIAHKPARQNTGFYQIRKTTDDTTGRHTGDHRDPLADGELAYSNFLLPVNFTHRSVEELIKAKFLSKRTELGVRAQPHAQEVLFQLTLDYVKILPSLLPPLELTGYHHYDVSTFLDNIVDFVHFMEDSSMVVAGQWTMQLSKAFHELYARIGPFDEAWPGHALPTSNVRDEAELSKLLAARHGLLERVHGHTFPTTTKEATTLLGVSIAALAVRFGWQVENWISGEPAIQTPAVLRHLEDIGLLLDRGAYANAHTLDTTTHVISFWDSSYSGIHRQTSNWGLFMAAFARCLTFRDSSSFRFDADSDLDLDSAVEDDDWAVLAQMPSELQISWLLICNRFMRHGASPKAPVFQHIGLESTKESTFDGVLVLARSQDYVACLFHNLFEHASFADFEQQDFRSVHELRERFRRSEGTYGPGMISTKRQRPLLEQANMLITRRRQGALLVPPYSRLRKSQTLDKLPPDNICMTQSNKLAIYSPYLPKFAGRSTAFITAESIVFASTRRLAYEVRDYEHLINLQISPDNDIVEIHDDGSIKQWQSPLHDPSYLVRAMTSSDIADNSNSPNIPTNSEANKLAEEIKAFNARRQELHARKAVENTDDSDDSHDSGDSEVFEDAREDASDFDN